jgi:predicted enzyme related to lactoylglutathione lyase
MNSSAPKLFKDIAFVIYPVSNIKAARAFYEDALGLQVTANWNDQWIEYDIGAGTLAIVTGDDNNRPGQSGVSVGLEVVDFDQMQNYLKQKAIPVAEGPFDSPVCRGCVVRDPDNNRIILHAKK